MPQRDTRFDSDTGLPRDYRFRPESTTVPGIGTTDYNKIFIANLSLVQTSRFERPLISRSYTANKLIRGQNAH